MWPPGEVSDLCDIESLVIAELKGSAHVLALLGDDSTRIASQLPPKQEGLFLQVLLDGGFIRIEGWLASARIRLEAWGPPRGDARALCIGAHALLASLRGESTDGLGIVTGVSTLTMPRKFIDPVNNRPRYQCELLVTAHPDPTAQSS